MIKWKVFVNEKVVNKKKLTFLYKKIFLKKPSIIILKWKVFVTKGDVNRKKLTKKKKKFLKKSCHYHFFWQQSTCVTHIRVTHVECCQKINNGNFFQKKIFLILFKKMCHPDLGDTCPLPFW